MKEESKEVRAIRRSLVTQANTWLFTLALTMPIMTLGGAANAQNQRLSLVVADFVNKSTGTTDALAANATAAVYNELVNSGRERFSVFGSQEVNSTAKTLGIRVPSVPGQPANFSNVDLLRLAKELPAEAIVQGEVAIVTQKGKPSVVGVSITFFSPCNGE